MWLSGSFSGRFCSVSSVFYFSDEETDNSVTVKAKKSLEGTEKSVPLQSPNEKGGPARGERIESCFEVYFETRSRRTS